MKIELDDRGAGVTPARPPVKLTCHGTPIGTVPCNADVWTSDSEFTGYSTVRCTACGRWSKTAVSIRLPGMTDDQVVEAMEDRAREYWETKPTQTYGDL